MRSSPIRERAARHGRTLSTTLRRARSFLAVAATGATSLVHGHAIADTQACVTSHASGQREAKAGRLKLASELFIACGSDSSCPEQLRVECTEMLESARAATPTVILSVLDEHGGDISAVKVFSTDELIVDGLDGRAIALDPGKHHLRFLLPWGEVLSQDVLIREGEKNRLIQVRVEPKAVKAEPGAAAPSAPPSVSPPHAESPPVAAWVATGVAVAGAGVFGTFAILGSRSKSDLDECAPNCPRSLEGTRDKLKTSYLIADIGLGTAVVSGALAIYFFASHGSSEATKPTAQRDGLRWKAAVAPIPNGAAVALSGSFQ